MGTLIRFPCITYIDCTLFCILYYILFIIITHTKLHIYTHYFITGKIYTYPLLSHNFVLIFIINYAMFSNEIKYTCSPFMIINLYIIVIHIFRIAISLVFYNCIRYQYSRLFIEMELSYVVHN